MGACVLACVCVYVCPSDSVMVCVGGGGRGARAYGGGGGGWARACMRASSCQRAFVRKVSVGPGNPAAGVCAHMYLCVTQSNSVGSF